jgi:hypothetical protein
MCDRSALVLAMVLILGAVSSPASAQVEAGFEISPGGGVIRGQGGTVKTLDVRRRRNIQTVLEREGQSFAFKGAYHLSPFIAMEGEFMWASNTHVATLEDFGSSVSTTENTSLTFVFGNGVVHLAHSRVTPYLTGGLGFLGTIEKISPAFNVGGGLHIFATPRAAIRVEAPYPGQAHRHAGAAGAHARGSRRPPRDLPRQVAFYTGDGGPGDLFLKRAEPVQPALLHP